MTLLDQPTVYMWDANVPRGILTGVVIELADQEIAQGIVDMPAVQYYIELMPNVAHLFNPLNLKGGDHLQIEKGSDGIPTSVKVLKRGAGHKVGTK